MPTSMEWLDFGRVIKIKKMKLGLKMKLRKCYANPGEKSGNYWTSLSFAVFSKKSKTTQNIKGSPFEYIAR